MGNLVQAAQDYLLENEFSKAALYLSIEFDISIGYAYQVCEQVEQTMAVA